MRYRRLVIVSDVLAVLVAVLVGELAGLGRVVPVPGDGPGVGLVAGALPVVGLHLTRAWDLRVLGHGREELVRVVKGVAAGAVVLGLLGLAFLSSGARPWAFALIPLAGVLAVAGRLVLRSRLHHLRAHGRCLVPVLAIGTPGSVADLVDRTRDDGAAGWVVVGACTPTGTGADGAATVDGVPVLGDLDAVDGVVARGLHRVVAVAATTGWSTRRLHELAWRLEDTGAELVVAPGLMDVAGQRLRVDPVGGTPLLRLAEPVHSGAAWTVKHVGDRAVALVLVVLLLPLLVAAAVAVKADGGGPVLARDPRVGRHGREFRLLRFRTTDPGSGRETRVGALLRELAFDELPQLFNVLAGTVALVGPRPPHPEEVATYGVDAWRRLLVKPGLTGLWQVSGRKDLSWEESVRLDLRYVENWTPALDLSIMRHTLGSVLGDRRAR